jgi:tetratricopeptide (TPR) repeat protein
MEPVGVIAIAFSMLMPADKPSPPEEPVAQPAAWIGKKVFPISPAVKLRGEDAEIAEFRSVPGVVRRVKRNRLYLRAGSFEGWVERAEVVPLEEAVEYFTGQLQSTSSSAWTHNMRGVAFDEQEDYDAAIEDYDEAIRLDPENPIPFNNRGNAWANKEDARVGRPQDAREPAKPVEGGQPVARQGEMIERAFADFDEALRLDPDYADAFNNRGTTWSDRRHYRKALADYAEAVRLDPKHAIAFDNRGKTWANLGEYEKALADFEESIRQDKEYAPAYNNRARLLATCVDARYRDGVKAVESAKRACELSKFKHFEHLDTLAAAHAECGEFEEAIRRQTTAIELAPDHRKEEFRKRLELYGDAQPYRCGRMPRGTP